jgi:hypothetical protein
MRHASTAIHKDINVAIPAVKQWIAERYETHVEACQKTWSVSIL